MYTVCPKCALTLVVTASDLRIAQGFVRCGRCSNVFNALARLSEDRNAVAQGVASATLSLPIPPQPPAREPQKPAAASQAPAAPAPAAPTEEEPIAESALEFNPEATDVSKVFIEQAPDPKWSAATGRFRALTRQKQVVAPAAKQAAPPVNPAAKPAAGPAAPPASPATPPAKSAKPAEPPVTTKAVHQPDDIELDADFLAAVTQTRRQPATPARAPARAPAPAETNTTRPISRAVGTAVIDAVAQVRLAAAAAQISDLEAPTAPAAVADGSQANRTSSLRHWWSAGAGALAIVLAVQVVHHYRHDLAANAQLYKPLTALYSALGIPLVPRWNLEAYDVRQLGASADSTSAGRITVRASVKNTAKQSQPLPLLRVTLQDLFGNRIAARDVPPGSYLPSAIPPSSFLSAGQRIDAEMVFVDPGSSAVGFEIDACLPAPGGSIACANDASPRESGPRQP